MTEPLKMPPAAAVYVNVMVLPVEPAEKLVVGVVKVPVPSSAYTLTEGEEARVVSVAAWVDFSCACQICAPPVDVAVAPSPALHETPEVAP